MRMPLCTSSEEATVTASLLRPAHGRLERSRTLAGGGQPLNASGLQLDPVHAPRRDALLRAQRVDLRGSALLLRLSLPPVRRGQTLYKSTVHFFNNQDGRLLAI